MQCNTFPTAPGKPGKIGPYLENLKKQGVLGQKPGKILQNLEKNFDLTLKKPKNLNNISIYNIYIIYNINEMTRRSCVMQASHR